MRSLLKISIVSAGVLAALVPMGTRAAFTIGNLAVEQLYTNGTSSTFEIVELNPFVSNSVPVNAIQIPYTGVGALRQSSAGSTGRLALSQDRTLLAFTAAEDPTGVSDETTITNRGVGTVDANGNYVLQTSYKGIGGSTKNQARGVTTLDDATWYCSDKGGVYTNNSGTAPVNGTNVRPIKSFGGVLYALSDNTLGVINQVSVDGTTLTALPGLATDANALDFYMFASGQNGVTNDTIYTDDGTQINKYCLVSGSWVSEGDIANCGVAADGLCAINTGTGAYIYVTSGTGGKVVQLTDANGYNQSISINTNNNSVIYAGAVYLKGIDFAPIPKLYTESLAQSTTSSQFSLVELNPYLSNSVPVNSVVIPITGASALRQINNGSSGRLALTADRTLLAFTGYSDPNGVANEASINLRGVGTIDSTPGGNYTLQATYTGLGGSTANQTRSATSLNNTIWYIGDKGGIYTNNVTTAVNTTNVRPIKVFGGTIYVCAATSSLANPPVLTTLSTDATSLTGLPGLGTTLDANAADFYMIQSGVDGTNYDIAYVNDGTTVTKYCLVSGSWTSLGTASLGVTADGFCALNIGGGAELFVTTGTGGKVVEITDTAGWNQAPTINTANNVVLYTGAIYLKGIEFAPVGGNVTVTLNTPPTITADPNASVDRPFTNTFTDNVMWRANITNIQVNGSTLPPAAYNTNVAGEIIFTPSASAILQGAGTLSIVYYATTFSAAQVNQPIAAGAPRGLAVKQQPLAPTGNGGTLVQQPKVGVVDQYGNLTGNTGTVTAAPNSAAWNFGPGSASTLALVNGAAAFTNLSAVSASAVSGAAISYTVSGVAGLAYNTTNSTAFNIPAPATSGFTPGNIVVEQLDASTANTTFSMLELNPAIFNAVPVNTFPVPATQTNGLRQSDSASTGRLANSQDGTLLTFTAGQWSDSTLGDVTTVDLRGCGSFNSLGNYIFQTSYTGLGDATANQARSATTIDDTTFWMGDKGGVYTNNNTPANAYIGYNPPANFANVRSLRAYNGTVYAMQQEGGTDPQATVMTIVTPPSSGVQELEPLAGFPIDGSVLDFSAVASGANGTNIDVIYYIDGTNATSGSIFKFTNSFTVSSENGDPLWANTGGSQGANWPTANGGDGLYVRTNASGGFDLFYTTGSGATVGNQVIMVHDSGAWNQPINLTATNIVYNAQPGTILKGVAAAPVTVTNGITVYPIGRLGGTSYVLGGGGSKSFDFSFTSGTGASGSFTVWSSTNVTLPFNQWKSLGHPVEAPPGTYSFADSTGATNPYTFYRVTSP